MFIPKFVIYLIPVLFSIFVCHLCKKGDTDKLWTLFIILVIPVMLLGYLEPELTIAGAPLQSRSGIMTDQITLSLFTTTLVIWLLRLKQVNFYWVNIIAILVGEAMLLETWVVR